MPRVILGDCLDELRKLPNDSVHCCVTSPPYWGLRDYGVEGQLGQEKTPEEFVEKLVTIFREVRRVLRGDGTLWLNLGDSYSAHAGKTHGYKDGRRNRAERKTAGVPDGIRAKNLIGVPWRVAGPSPLMNGTCHVAGQRQRNTCLAGGGTHLHRVAGGQ